MREEGPRVISNTTLLVDLNRGEAEAMALALEIDAQPLLVGERLARRCAQRAGL